MAFAKDFNDFVRPGICVSSSFVTIAGALIAHAPMFYVFASAIVSLLSCAAVYSFNNITDSEEDRKNGRLISPFVVKKWSGVTLALLFALLAVACAILTVPAALLISVMFIVTGVAYSIFRIKKYILLKNIYTAFLISLSFLLGMGFYAPGAAFYFFVIYSTIFVGSVISDMRDVEGDRGSGIRTVPVAIGIMKTKYLVAALIIITTAAMMVDARRLFVFSLFAFASLLLIIKNDFARAHKIGMSSFLFFDIWMALAMF